MRLFTATLAALLIAGCASQPKETTVSAPVAAPAPAPAPAAKASPSAAGATAQTAATKGYPGYKAKQKNGTTYYCKKIARIGSNFQDETCLTAAEIDQMNDKAEEDRSQFRKNQTLCGTGGCGGG